MTKIFQFPGQGPKKEKNTETDKQRGDETKKSPESLGQEITRLRPRAEKEPDLESFLEKLMAARGIEHIQLTTVLKMKRFLDSLQGPGAHNPANISLRRAGLKDFKDEDLRSMARKSTESDWKAKPSFYYALIAEIQHRNLE